MKSFEFKPSIKQPSIIPYRIEGEMTPEVLREINAIIDEKYNGNKNLKVLEMRKINGVQIAVGSNPLILPVVEIVASKYRTGRPEDFQRTLNDDDTLSIKGNHYADLGVVLDFTGRNHEMALDLYQQLPKKLQDLRRIPSVVVGYGLKNADFGNYRLGLVHNANTQVRPAPILAKSDGNFRDEDVSLKDGLPTRLGTGNRTLYTASQKAQSLDNLGLSRLCLVGCLDLGSNFEYLACSGDSGRVVLF